MANEKKSTTSGGEKERGEGGNERIATKAVF